LTEDLAMCSPKWLAVLALADEGGNVLQRSDGPDVGLVSISGGWFEFSVSHSAGLERYLASRRKNCLLSLPTDNLLQLRASPMGIQEA
jgi:hypothetical protein